jgi:hypothetical protein
MASDSIWSVHDMLTLLRSQVWLQEHVEEYPWLAHLQQHYGLPSADIVSIQGASSADSAPSAAASSPSNAITAVDPDADSFVDYAVLANVAGT